MRILRWCGRHKIWTGLIVVILVVQLVGLVFPDNAFTIGRLMGNVVGIMLIFYLVIHFISRGKRQKGIK